MCVMWKQPSNRDNEVECDDEWTRKLKGNIKKYPHYYITDIYPGRQTCFLGEEEECLFWPDVFGPETYN